MGGAREGIDEKRREGEDEGRRRMRRGGGGGVEGRARRKGEGDLLVESVESGETLDANVHTRREAPQK